MMRHELLGKLLRHAQLCQEWSRSSTIPVPIQASWPPTLLHCRGVAYFGDVLNNARAAVLTRDIRNQATGRACVSGSEDRHPDVSAETSPTETSLNTSSSGELYEIRNSEANTSTIKSLETEVSLEEEGHNNFSHKNYRSGAFIVEDAENKTPSRYFVDSGKSSTEQNSRSEQPSRVHPLAKRTKR